MSVVNVTVHPEKLNLLARATVAGARELAHHGAATARLLDQYAESPEPGLDLLRASQAMAECASGLVQVLSSLWLLEARGGVIGGLRLLTGPVTGSHRDPARARAAALRAARSWHAGDRAAFVADARRWYDDPVFAVLVLHAVGPDIVVDELAMLAATWGFGDDDPSRRDHQAVAMAMAGTLATASRAGDAPWDPVDLAAVAERRGHPSATLGLLGLAEVSWDPGYLASLVHVAVVPTNRELMAGEMSTSHLVGGSHRHGGGERALDTRVVLLARVAADPAAARLAMAGADLRALLDGRADYLDGGAALGDLLVAATLPPPGVTPWSAIAPAQQAVLAGNVERLVRAVVAVESLPPRTHDALGIVGGPWVAAFGSDTFDGFGLVDPIPTLDSAIAGAFVDIVMSSEVAAGHLWAAGFAWSAATLAALGPAPDVVAAKRVGDVLRVLSDGSHRSAATRSAARDADQRAQSRVWGRAVSAASGAGNLAPPPWSVVASGAGLVGSHAIDRVTSDGDHELTYLRALPDVVAHEQRALEYLSLAVLWDQRDRNGLFASAGARSPDDDRARHLGDAGLLDAAGHLAPYPTLGPSGRAAFDVWLLEENRRGSAVAGVLDGIGEAFGKGTAR